MFVQNAQPNLFMGPTQQPAQNSLFNQPNTSFSSATTNAGFGNAQPALVRQNAIFGSSAPPTGGSLFGQNPPAQGPTVSAFGGFGGTSAPAPSGGLFGSTAPSVPPLSLGPPGGSGGLFGNTSTQPNTLGTNLGTNLSGGLGISGGITQPNNPLFGGSTGAPTSTFGRPSATSGFGGPQPTSSIGTGFGTGTMGNIGTMGGTMGTMGTSGGFGTGLGTNTGFGAPAPSGGLFGTNAPQPAGSLFGGNPTGAVSAFGQQSGIGLSALNPAPNTFNTALSSTNINTPSFGNAGVSGGLTTNAFGNTGFAGGLQNANPIGGNFMGGMQQKGTSSQKFEKVRDTDSNDYFVHILAKEPLKSQDKNIEEYRFEDYMMRKSGQLQFPKKGGLGFGTATAIGTGLGTGIGTNVNTGISGFNTNINTSFAPASNLNAPKPGGLFGNTSTAPGLFGNTNPAPTASSGLFGNTNPTNINTGTQPSSLFGNTQPQGNSLFGNTGMPTGGLFNSALGSTNPATAQNTAGGLFGAKPAGPAPSGGGLFGSPTQPATGGLFGNTGTQPGGTGLFGNTLNQGLQPVKPITGGTGLFGNTGTTTTLFGGQPQSGMQQNQQIGNMNNGRIVPDLSDPYGLKSSLLNTTETGTINSDLSKSTIENMSRYATPYDDDDLLKIKPISVYQEWKYGMMNKLAANKLIEAESYHRNDLSYYPKDSNSKSNKSSLYSTNEKLLRSRDQFKKLELTHESYNSKSTLLERKRKPQDTIYTQPMPVKRYQESDNVYTLHVTAHFNNQELLARVKLDKTQKIKDVIEEVLSKLNKKYGFEVDGRIRLLKFGELLRNDDSIEEAKIKNGDGLILTVDQENDEESESEKSSNNSEVSDSDSDEIIEKNNDQASVKLAPREILPKQPKEGYKISPDYTTICRMTEKELQNIENFNIENEYGKIEFLEKVDLTNEDLALNVTIKHMEVVVYPDDSKRPVVGKKMNVPAIITLYKCVPKKAVDIEKFKQRLQRTAEKQNVFFVTQN